MSGSATLQHARASRRRAFERLLDQRHMSSPCRLPHGHHSILLSSASNPGLIGTGMSGALIVPTVGDSLGLPFAMVRQAKSQSARGIEHQVYSYDIIGRLAPDLIFLDDLIDGGSTIRYVEEVASQYGRPTGKFGIRAAVLNSDVRDRSLVVAKLDIPTLRMPHAVVNIGPRQASEQKLIPAFIYARQLATTIR